MFWRNIGCAALLRWLDSEGVGEGFAGFGEEGEVSE